MSVIDFFLTYWDWYLLIGFFFSAGTTFSAYAAGRLKHTEALVVSASVLFETLFWPAFVVALLTTADNK